MKGCVGGFISFSPTREETASYKQILWFKEIKESKIF